MKQLNIYFFLFAVALAAVSFLQIINAYYIGEFYYLAICLALILGILFTRLLSNNLQSQFFQNTYRIFISTSLIVVASLVIAYLVCTRFVVYPIFLSYHLAFIIPVIMRITFEFFILIPDDEYKLWYYPASAGILPLAIDLNQQTTPVPFVLNKELNNPKKSRLSVESPVEMPVSKIFYQFLSRYNQSNPASPICEQDQDAPFGWVFFSRRGFMAKRIIIDPELSVRANGLQQGENIYAERVFSPSSAASFQFTGA